MSFRPFAKFKRPVAGATTSKSTASSTWKRWSPLRGRARLLNSDRDSRAWFSLHMRPARTRTTCVLKKILLGRRRRGVRSAQRVSTKRQFALNRCGQGRRYNAELPPADFIYVDGPSSRATEGAKGPCCDVLALWDRRVRPKTIVVDGRFPTIESMLKADAAAEYDFSPETHYRMVTAPSAAFGSYRRHSVFRLKIDLRTATGRVA
jgi:hypothetical protein